MKGKFYVEVYDGDRRRSLCLRTDSYELACQRYPAGLKELCKRIRREDEATKPSTWQGFRQLLNMQQDHLGRLIKQEMYAFHLCPIPIVN